MNKLIYLSLLFLAVSGCKKEEKQPLLDGTYSGTFRMLINQKEQSSDFEITLNEQRFTTNKGGMGFGTFEISTSDKMKFVDERLYTAYYNHSTLLGGDYFYSIKGDSLILDKIFETVPSTYYQYRLKKIK